MFSPPTRRQLADGLTLLRLPQGLTKQTFHILSKIQEVDAFLRPRDQARVVEAHPELALARLAGRPMRWNKKTRNGRRERLRALARLPLAWRRGLAPILKGQGADLARTDVAPDDILDAAALAWTAWRVYGGTAIRLPQDPPKDRRGLRMEILY